MDGNYSSDTEQMILALLIVRFMNVRGVREIADFSEYPVGRGGLRVVK